MERTVLRFNQNTSRTLPLSLSLSLSRIFLFSFRSVLALAPCYIINTEPVCVSATLLLALPGVHLTEPTET